MKYLLPIVVLTLIGAGCENPRTCLRSHDVVKTRGAWVQMLPTGNGRYIPIYHDEETYTETVCDEYAPELQKHP